MGSRNLNDSTWAPDENRIGQGKKKRPHKVTDLSKLDMSYQQKYDTLMRKRYVTRQKYSVVK